MQDPYAYEATEEPIEPVEPPQMEAAEHGLVVPMSVMLSPDQMEAIAKRMQLQQAVITLQKMAGLDNVAEAIDPDELGKIGSQVVREYKLDQNSRGDWESRARRAMDLAKQKKESKSFPWPDASNVKYPMLTTASLQFAARAYPAIIDGPRIVKCKVLGADPQGIKAGAGDRISQHMSYQLLVEVPEWESDVDTLLHQIPIIGCAFKKVYPDNTKPAGFCDDLISAFDLVVNQSAKSLETVPRITHVFTLYPYEVSERIRSGRYIEFELSKKTDKGDDSAAPHTFLEQHCYLDLDGDGTLEPWIVTVHEDTQKVVRLKPGFAADDLVIDQERGVIVKIPRKNYFVKIPFVPDPEGGFYDIGFGHLLEPISDVIDTTINQMMDAGTLQNAGGGFVGGGVNLGKGKSEIRLRPGEYKTLPNAGNDIRNAIVDLKHPGPSSVLFELLGMMTDAGKQIAGIQDIMTGDTDVKTMQPTTLLALIEQGMKVFTAIYKRIFRALRAEYKMIFDINKANAQLQMGKYVALLDEPVQVVQADYMGDLDVMPVSDPNTITDMQRMAKANLVLEEARNGNPSVNLFQATLRAFEAARIEKPEEVLVKPPEGPSPEEQLKLEGLKAEVEKMKAEVDRLRAETDKMAADAAKVRAEASLPLGVPIPIAEPQFTPPELFQSSMQPGMPMDVPPEMMQGGPTPDMDMGAMMGEPMQGQNPLMGMVPELQQQMQEPGGEEMPQDSVQ